MSGSNIDVPLPEHSTAHSTCLNDSFSAAGEDNHPVSESDKAHEVAKQTSHSPLGLTLQSPVARGEPVGSGSNLDFSHVSRGQLPEVGTLPGGSTAGSLPSLSSQRSNLTRGLSSPNPSSGQEHDVASSSGTERSPQLARSHKRTATGEIKPSNTSVHQTLMVRAGETRTLQTVRQSPRQIYLSSPISSLHTHGSHLLRGQTIYHLFPNQNTLPDHHSHLKECRQHRHSHLPQTLFQVVVAAPAAGGRIQIKHLKLHATSHRLMTGSIVSSMNLLMVHRRFSCREHLPSNRYLSRRRRHITACRGSQRIRKMHQWNKTPLKPYYSCPVLVIQLTTRVPRDSKVLRTSAKHAWLRLYNILASSWSFGFDLSGIRFHARSCTMTLFFAGHQIITFIAH
ncbi:hypothetical protein AFUB_029200 [Aspergillus fumigatus A1163]|uniref:Uncharacterized protein n=1 Tax=Aspergillus fumigatus (strain CBS 144.89 / FGSC A1163 / CEA10) TaxID=451804 RepID=B0XTF2_ASPFC|nr:hypothetical protein AFUB_029200 [Aspergillus fumigatus A1163]